MLLSSKPRFLVAALLVLLVMLSACQAMPAAGPQANTPEQMARAQSLNIAINGRIADPTNLNLYAPGVSRSNTGLHQIVYEYFFYQNLQTGEYIPWLAESYQYNDDFTAINCQVLRGTLTELIDEIGAHLDDPRPPTWYMASAPVDALLPGLRDTDDLNFAATGIDAPPEWVPSGGAIIPSWARCDESGTAALIGDGRFPFPPPPTRQ